MTKMQAYQGSGGDLGFSGKRHYVPPFADSGEDQRCLDFGEEGTRPASRPLPYRRPDDRR